MNKKYNYNKINKVLILFNILICIVLLFLIFNDNAITHTQSKTTGTNYTELTKDNNITQFFVSGANDLEALKIKFGTFQKKLLDKTVKIKIKKDDKVICESKINTDIIFDNQYTTFTFDNIENDKNELLELEISCSECNEHDLAIFYGNSQVNNKSLEKLILETENYGYVIDLQLIGTNYGYGYIIFFTILLLFGILFLGINNRKKIITKFKRVQNFINKYHLFYIGEFILSLIVIMCIYKLVYISNYQYGFSIRYYSLLIISMIIFIFYLLMKDYYKLKLESLFLIIVIPISSCYLFFLTPLSIPDELTHYTTAYQISKGNVLNFLPGEVPENLATNKAQKYYNLDIMLKSGNDHTSTKFERTVRYSPIVYMPSALGLGIGRILSLNSTISFYIAKLFNLIVFLLVGYFLIKLIPIGKLVMFVYLLNPLMMQQASSLSADAIVNNICLLLIAHTLYLLKKKSNITIKDLTLLGALMIITAGVKYVYILILLLPILLLIKRRKEFSKKEKIVMLIILIFSIAMWIAIYAYGRYDSSKLDNSKINYEEVEMSQQSHIRNINSREQLQFLLTNPHNLIMTIYKTTIVNAPFYLTSFLGQSLGALNINVSIIVSVIYLFLLLISILLSNEKMKYNLSTKIAMFIIAIMEYLAIILGMSMQWTSVGEFVAEGVQGRYFLPFLILPLLACISNKNKLTIKNREMKLSVILILIHVITISTIICYFI